MSFGGLGRVRALISQGEVGASIFSSGVLYFPSL
jgi:hypothetical protein